MICMSTDLFSAITSHYSTITTSNELLTVSKNRPQQGTKAKRETELRVVTPPCMRIIVDCSKYLNTGDRKQIAKANSRQLRILRTRAAPRGGAGLCRPQFHPGRLAGRADAADRRHRGSGWRADPVPPHVHLDDHASAFGCGHGRGAGGVDREDRSAGPALDEQPAAVAVARDPRPGLEVRTTLRRHVGGMTLRCRRSDELIAGPVEQHRLAGDPGVEPVLQAIVRRVTAYWI